MAEDWITQFNLWRKNYDSLSFEAHQSFMNSIEAAFPHQFQASLPALETSLQLIANHLSHLKILELGGWKGEAANIILSKPIYQNLIQQWDNYELCSMTEYKAVCSTPQYFHIILDDWLWNSFPLSTNYDVFIASHVLEHIKATDVNTLFEKLDTLNSLAFLYLDIPIPENTTPFIWENYPGTHILEIGWNDLNKRLEQQGWTISFQYNSQIRLYWKKELLLKRNR